jgi:hypothetical protein
MRFSIKIHPESLKRGYICQLIKIYLSISKEVIFVKSKLQFYYCFFCQRLEHKDESDVTLQFGTYFFK